MIILKEKFGVVANKLERGKIYYEKERDYYISGI